MTKILKKTKAYVKVLRDHSSEEDNHLESLQAEIAQLRRDTLAAAYDYASAETCYEEALELTEHESKVDIATVLHRRARLHQIMGELEQAISALTKCIN